MAKNKRRNLAEQFIAIAEKQDATTALIVGNRLMAMSLKFNGFIAESLRHYDQSISVSDPAAQSSVGDAFRRRQ